MSDDRAYEYLSLEDRELDQKGDESVFPSRELTKWYNLPEFTISYDTIPGLVINFLAPLIRISAIVIVFCSIIDIGLILYFIFSVSTRTSAFTSPVDLPYDIDKLPVVSTYVEFDDLYRNKRPSTNYPPIINRARNFIHVSSELSNRDTVFPIWPNSHVSIDGTLPVLENRLLLTENVRLYFMYTYCRTILTSYIL